MQPLSMALELLFGFPGMVLRTKKAHLSLGRSCPEHVTPIIHLNPLQFQMMSGDLLRMLVKLLASWLETHTSSSSLNSARSTPFMHSQTMCLASIQSSCTHSLPPKVKIQCHISQAAFANLQYSITVDWFTLALRILSLEPLIVQHMAGRGR